jgi:REP element-mobilizing transposase RayT
MAWQQRLCGENLYHHIFAWGNNRNRIFSSDQHYTNYLELMAIYAKSHQIDIIAYALMEWHVHLFIYDTINTMANFMQDLHSMHARYYNHETNRVGHAFGERYNNIIVQPNNYALSLSKYIHRQAVEAGLVTDPKMYEWTSYHRYIGLEPHGFVKPNIILDQFGENVSQNDRVEQYINFVKGDKADTVDWDKRNFNVVGDSSFCAQIKHLNREKKNIKVIPNDLILIACIKLGVERDQLLNPCGRGDKELRHRAFLLLVKEYGCSYNEIAQLFKVTRLTVLKAIARQNNIQT